GVPPAQVTTGQRRSDLLADPGIGRMLILMIIRLIMNMIVNPCVGAFHPGCPGRRGRHPHQEGSSISMFKYRSISALWPGYSTIVEVFSSMTAAPCGRAPALQVL